MFFSCCCGKCAPKKPEEDEDAPDLGDLTAEEETEVTKSACNCKVLHKIEIGKVHLYLNVKVYPFFYKSLREAVISVLAEFVR